MKRIDFYIVRHGQTYTNIRELLIGQGGSAPLTPQGRRDALCLGLGLREIDFQAVYVSPLARTRQTARLITMNRGLTLETAHGVRDISWGDLEGASAKDAIDMFKGRDLGSHGPFGPWDNPDYDTGFGGENKHRFIERFERQLQEIAELHKNTGGNILVVCHSTVSIFLEKYIGYEISNVANTSVSVVSWENGRFYPGKLNDTSYLESGRAVADRMGPLRIQLFGDAETLFSSRGLIEGQSDSALTPKGERQAAHLRDSILDRACGAVYTSELGRACAVGRILAGRDGIPFEERAGLNGLFLAHWEAERIATIEAGYPAEAKALTAGGDILGYRSPAGGENGLHAALRFKDTLADLCENVLFRKKCIAVVSHDIVLRAFCALEIPEAVIAEADGVKYLNLAYSDGVFSTAYSQTN